MITEFKNEYQWLSNFAPVVIKHDGITYPSVEHFYVAMKTMDKVLREKISNFEHPGQAKKYGQKITIRSDWDSVKLKVMEYGLIQKFNQEPYKSKLIQTRDTYIQEGNYWGDTFWGIDLKTETGENHLGKLIMNIRKQLV